MKPAFSANRVPQKSEESFSGKSSEFETGAPAGGIFPKLRLAAAALSEAHTPFSFTLKKNRRYDAVLLKTLYHGLHRK